MLTSPIFHTAGPRGRVRAIGVSLTTLGVLAGLMAMTAGPADAAASPVGTTVYVPNLTAGTVSVVNGSTNTITATVPVGADPIDTAVTPDGSQNWEMALSPDGSALYIASGFNLGLPGAESSIEVLNTATNTISATIPLGANTFPIGLALSPDGSTIYTSDQSSNSVSVISTATDTVTSTIAGFSEPTGLALTPNGATAYVSDAGDNTVKVLNIATGTITATISGFSVPYLLSQHTNSYSFTGFFPPVRNSPAVNHAAAGWIIPLTFKLDGNQGLNIFNAGDPAVQQINCTTGAPIGAASPAQPVGQGLYYIGFLDTYTYLWQTSRAWRGTCQEFSLGLNDGSTHTADFNFNLGLGVPWPFTSRAVKTAQARAAS